MIKDFMYFRPVEGLRDMVRDHSGSTIMGLYQLVGEGRPVLIGHCAHDLHCVFWPEPAALSDVLKGNDSMYHLLLAAPWTTTGKQPFNLLYKMQVRLWIARYFEASAGARHKHVMHPDLDALVAASSLPGLRP